MDQTTAQNAPPPVSDSPYSSASPLKKFLPVIMIIFFLGLVSFLLLFLRYRLSSNNTPNIPTPTLRPTATPINIAPTIPEASPEISSPSSAPKEVGNLVFIKDGDIYDSNFTNFSLLHKNTIPAGDKLSWDNSGNFLSWRPKQTQATPSALTILNRNTDNVETIKTSEVPTAELINYAWSGWEGKLALLIHDQSYKISIANVSSKSAGLVNLVSRVEPINDIIWSDQNTIIFLGSEGIVSLDVKSLSFKPLVGSNNIINMILSPDRKKILYAIGDKSKSNLYIINTDGTVNAIISSQPESLDMGTTGLTAEVLKKGFLPFAVWFPDSTKLLVGFHYLEGLPLVGIYDLKKNSLSMIAPFVLKKEDFMIDDYRLVGARVRTSLSDAPNWQLSIFTLEDNSKLGLIRVIPGASSPSFYFSDLQ
mgnify:CR=1 FL=1